MDIKIYKAKPKFSLFNKNKDVVMVEFPNCISSITGESFIWLPSYPQLEAIKTALKEIEIKSLRKCQYEIAEIEDGYIPIGFKREEAKE